MAAVTSINAVDGGGRGGASTTPSSSVRRIPPAPSHPALKVLSSQLGPPAQSCQLNVIDWLTAAHKYKKTTDGKIYMYLPTICPPFPHPTVKQSPAPR